MSLQKIIKKDTNILAVLYLLCMISGLGLIGWLLIKEFFPMPITDFLTIFILPCILYLAVIVYMLNYFIWQITGYEDITVNSQEIIIQRRGKIITEREKIKIKTIKSIVVINYEDISSTWFVSSPGRMSRLIGETGGRVRIKYNEKFLDFGQGLTEEEAIKFVSEIKEYLKDNKITGISFFPL